MELHGAERHQRSLQDVRRRIYKLKGLTLTTAKGGVNYGEFCE